MGVKILNLTSSADTGEQGKVLLQAMQTALSDAGEIAISFQGVSSVTSSFVNTSFVALLDIMSFSEIKSRVRIINSNHQINDMIKTRIQHEANCSRVCA